MLNTPWTSWVNYLHARLCYQLFITPIAFPMDKQYREFARHACAKMQKYRTAAFHEYHPRHHVIHYFAPTAPANGKKILVAHGWISRAAYMIHIISHLQSQGYEVYAPDFPAHGEAKGLQLLWIDAATIVRETLNRYGPFHGVVGHSFGGAILLNILNLAGQFPQWALYEKPQRVVLIASPIKIRSPMRRAAKKLKLNGSGLLHLRQLLQQQTQINFNTLHLRQFIQQAPVIPFLCIHGDSDKTIPVTESIRFSRLYPQADLRILPHANHVSVLMDKRVETLVKDFMD